MHDKRMCATRQVCEHFLSMVSMGADPIETQLKNVE